MGVHAGVRKRSAGKNEGRIGGKGIRKGRKEDGEGEKRKDNYKVVTSGVVWVFEHPPKFQEKNGTENRPVSYTHLTLPTIYSV